MNMIVVEDETTDVLVEHTWGVGRDLYYANLTTLDMYYLYHEPKNGIPEVFIDPSVGDAGRCEIPTTVIGGLIAGVPLFAVLLLAQGLSSVDYFAFLPCLSLASVIGRLTYRHTYHISYTRVREGKGARIVGWVPRDYDHEAQPCSVPREGEDDFGPTVSLQMGRHSGISMVVPPETTHRVGYSRAEVVDEERGFS